MMEKLYVAATAVLLSLNTYANEQNILLTNACDAQPESSRCVATGAELMTYLNDSAMELEVLNIFVGEGEFELSHTDNLCRFAKDVSITGQGVGKSRVTGNTKIVNGPINRLSAVLSFEDCNRVSVNNLSIQTSSVANKPNIFKTSSVGVHWWGKGQSDWRNIEILSGDYAWLDNGGAHNFDNVTLINQSAYSVAATSQMREGMIAAWTNGGLLTLRHSQLKVLHDSPQPISGAIGVFNYGGEVSLIESQINIDITTDSKFDIPEFGGLGVYSDYNGKTTLESVEIDIDARLAKTGHNTTGLWIGGYADGYNDAATLSETKINLVTAPEGNAEKFRVTETAKLITK